MSARLETDVLIVGGGPAGMVSALCLAELGVCSIIVERHADVNPHPKAHELNARSIEILNELGISMEELAREAAPDADGSRILFCKTINDEFGRIDLLADGGSAQKYARHLRSDKPYLNLSQTELERAVRKHIRKNPRITLMAEHDWERFSETHAGVLSQVRPVVPASDAIQIESRYLIGADGAASKVRQLLGIEMVGPDRLQDFVNAYFEIGLRDYVHTPAKLYWIFHPAAVGAFIAHHVDKRWTYNMPVTPPYEKREDFTAEVLKKRIETALGTDEYEIEIKSISHWRMTAQVADAYRRGRVFLVGDSAHRFPPTGGLGMNTGIADAHNLGWKLAAVLQGRSDEALLDSYELERKPVAERNGEESRANFERIFEVIEAFGLDRNAPELMARVTNHPFLKRMPGFIRRALLGLLRAPAHLALGRFHWSARVREKVLSSIEEQRGHFDRIGLDIGYIYQEGALVAEESDARRFEQEVMEYEPTTRPGARFPHVPLSGSGDLRSSHELVEYSKYTLLVDEAGAPWKVAITNLSAALRSRVQGVSMDQIGANSESLARLRSVCEIEAGGALLIRPDGHVAWRHQGASPDPTGVLRAAFEALGVR
jgi:2,4-dichlorophenol 6-monooxygenase